MASSKGESGAVNPNGVPVRFRELAVQLWPVGRVRPFARNSRTHTPEQVAQVAASIARFGWTNPILTGDDGVIIAGHARLEAAKKLGISEVPVIVLDHLTETERRALVIADNKLAENAGWNEGMLAEELELLDAEGFELELTGFSDEELDTLLADPEQEGLTDEDAAPEEPEHPVTVSGDVWIMGNHRLVCGDSTDAGVVATVLAGSLADMVFTDPPYNVAYKGGMKRRRKIANDSLGADFAAFLRGACENMLAVTKGALYICMSCRELHTLRQGFEGAGGHWSAWVVWAKNNFAAGFADYRSQHEPILYGWREGAEHYWCGARDQSDLWPVKRAASNEKHPTQKPVELVERAIKNSSKGRDIVLDAFAGSGTTVIACERTGRQARVIELEPGYCDVTVRRWQDFTGEQAKHEATGRAFDEIAASMAGAK